MTEKQKKRIEEIMTELGEMFIKIGPEFKGEMPILNDDGDQCAIVEMKVNIHLLDEDGNYVCRS